MSGAAQRKLGDNPEDLRLMAQWMQMFAGRLEFCAGTVGRAAKHSLAHWDDLAGRAFVVKIGDAVLLAQRLSKTAEKLAGLYHRCADALYEAEPLMVEAEEMALTAGLRVEHGWIYPPEWEDVRTYWHHGKPDLNAGELHDMENQAIAALQQVYDAAEAKAEAASKIVLDLIKEMEDGMDEVQSFEFPYGSIAKGTVAEMVEVYQLRKPRPEEGPSKFEQTLIGIEINALGETFETAAELHAENNKFAGIYAPRNAGLVGLFLEFGGRLIAGVGVAYELYTGSPPQKIIFTAGAAWFVGGAVAAVASSNPGGWAFAGATVVGIFASELYDWAFPETARLQLFGDRPD